MKIGIEGFLLDNALMNWLILALAAALAGVRLALWRCLAMSLFGAVYALLSLSALPFLASLPAKLLLLPLMALPLYERGLSYGKLLLATAFAAVAVGGLTLGMTLLLGGQLSGGGVLVGAIPLRAAILSAAAAAALPRAMRLLWRCRRTTEERAVLLLQLGKRHYRLSALIDTGNRLFDPVTGLPVILVCGVPLAGGRPLPCCTQGGDTVLYGLRPTRIELLQQDGTIVPVDALIARAPRPIVGADALLPPLLTAQSSFDR